MSKKENPRIIPEEDLVRFIEAIGWKPGQSESPKRESMEYERQSVEEKSTIKHLEEKIDLRFNHMEQTISEMKEDNGGLRRFILQNSVITIFSVAAIVSAALFLLSDHFDA